MVCETVKSILPCKSVCTCGITTPSGESPAELEPPRVGAGLWPTAYRRQNAHYQRNGAEKPQPNTVQYTNYNAVNDDMHMQFGRWETEIQTHTDTQTHTQTHTQRHTQTHRQRHRHKHKHRQTETHTHTRSRAVQHSSNICSCFQRVKP